MRVSWVKGAVWLVLLCGAGIGWGAPASCRTGSLEGEVRGGELFVRPIGNGLEVMLEPLASGWILRVLPAGKPRPPHDHAELATPPYRSVSPLLITTDYSFRAQDAVGWNPRRFRFAPEERSFQELLKAYDEYESKGVGAATTQQRLAGLVSRAPEGTLTIVDAHLVPGTADQAAAAAAVASHFAATAHTLERPADGRTTALGRLTWMRFRIAIELPRGFAADRRLTVSNEPCGRP
ncbi:hypothetical protein [Edaphobacter aggregans]|uniref:hypothetical protein n=1 Tax=Edaphobacter aggregans TaxID=570835 RepID=UPI00055951AE|nr:hypothetical protein [Edaphobacter aggregans]